MTTRSVSAVHKAPTCPDGQGGFGPFPVHKDIQKKGGALLLVSTNRKDPVPSRWCEVKHKLCTIWCARSVKPQADCRNVHITLPCSRTFMAFASESRRTDNKTTTHLVIHDKEVWYHRRGWNALLSSSSFPAIGRFKIPLFAVIWKKSDKLRTSSVRFLSRYLSIRSWNSCASDSHIRMNRQ